MNKDPIEAARFLIVDDEVANVAVLEQMLEQWGCVNVVSTTDGREALALYTEYRPDIMLLDLMMPHLDGFAVMEALRPLLAAEGYMPILVLTADTSIPTKRRALAAGATDFLTKPFDAVELSLRVRTLVQTRFLHQQLAEQNRLLETRVQQRTQELAQAEIDAVACLALAAEFRDDDTGHHTQRVGHTAGLLAHYLGLHEAHVALIQQAAPLHDVGKIGVPDSILLKPGRLTDDEFAVMQRHAEMGAQILERHHNPLFQLAARIARAHHERWDGAGYPHGLVGAQIPVEGRLVALADVYDALTHARPYKAAWPAEEAVAELHRLGGRQFDPALVELFLTLASRAMLPIGDPAEGSGPGKDGHRER